MSKKEKDPAELTVEDVIENYQGACLFCGQGQMIRCESQEAANKIATVDCDCDSDDKRYYSMESAIRATFSQDADEDVMQFLLKAAEHTFHKNIQSISVNLWGVTAKLSSTAKGKVKIVRATSRNDQVEV